MKIADIKIGYTCNNNCIHCVVTDLKDICESKKIPIDQTTQQYKDRIRDAQKNGAQAIIFTGGEPTLREDFSELLEYTISLGLSVELQSNGRLFADKEFAEKTAHTAKIDYAIALHGHCAGVHDAVTRSPGSFRETVDGIKNLLRFGQKINGKLVINKINYPYLLESVKFFYDIGLNGICYTFPAGQGEAGKNFYDVVPRYSEIIPYLQPALDYIKANKWNVNTESVPMCFMPGHEEVSCELYQHKDNYRLYQYGAEDFFRDADCDRVSQKRKAPVCGHCMFDALCEGVYKDYPEHYGFAEFKPVTQKTESARNLIEGILPDFNKLIGYCAPPEGRSGEKLAEFSIPPDIKVKNIDIVCNDGKMEIWVTPV